MKELRQKLEERNFEVHLLTSKDQLLPLLDSMIPDHSICAAGGSLTLEQCGVIDYLKQRKIKFLDRYQKGIDREQIMREAFFSDYYLTSTNALTKDGVIVNTDGRCNRVSAMLYGPKNVIIIAGKNKIVSDEKAALKRIKDHATPLNVKRLDRELPCKYTDHCLDCHNINCIRAATVFIDHSLEKNRIKLILIDEELGY